MSLTNFDLRPPRDQTQFIGLDNYVRMTTDPLVGQSLIATFKFALIVDPRHDGREPGLRPAAEPPASCPAKGPLRTLVYMPIMIPLVASTLVWIGFLNTETGLAEPDPRARRAAAAGLDQQRDLDLPGADADRACGRIGNFMIINIAGLQSVPTELYEAARIDGAGCWTHASAGSRSR